MHRYLVMAWALPIAVAAPLACAQAEAGHSRPDPQDAKASVPPVSYESPFANYRVLSDDKPTSWRESNDTVGRIGGWRAYAKEAEDAKPAGEAGPAKGAEPRQGGHDGHKH